MKFAIAFLACVAVVTATGYHKTHDIKVADKAFLMKQKFLFEIVYRVEDPLMFEEYIAMGKQFFFEKEHYTHFDLYMDKFFEAHKAHALLPKGEFFGALVKHHAKQARGLFNFFYYAKDWETFAANVAFARMHFNEGMFVYALTLAVIHRDDFHGLVLPAIHEIFPQFFFNSKFVMEAEKFDYEMWMKTSLYEKEYMDVYHKKIDPLTRIQEEIKEVVRREEEYRQLATLSSSASITSASPDFETYTVNGNFEPKLQQDDEHDLIESPDQDQGMLVTAQPAAVQTTSLLLPIDELSNTPSLASSVNSAKEESLDGQHSDDSGISASSQSNTLITGITTNVAKQQPLKLTVVTRQEQRYIGPNCYNLTPEPPQQKLITRTISTPQLSGLPQKRQFAFGGATKGVMQRFIASHGKLGNTSPLPAASPMTISLGAANGNGGLNVNGPDQQYQQQQQ
ncbi:GM11568 [Drosophila sechellia]|uniref:GM11568 n=1 Tax=Drosophila sechellia TaxID=7238 RepID=B4IGG3_DROSE|nr:GM11568 [Drosophila sechellia]